MKIERGDFQHSIRPNISFDELGQDNQLEAESSNEGSDNEFYISNIPKEEEYLTYINEAVLPKKTNDAI
ncbi:hypothetical protein EDB80DRAFT_623463 [Ilyonectria destructans]|nr:hypothetical protein EDB80DRAFT_625110 [Ilyonectria destructans]KAH6988753.1 hypothetical protein EDB80DRAFT_623463 [Ilyonectria destructans]